MIAMRQAIIALVVGFALAFVLLVGIAHCTEIIPMVAKNLRACEKGLHEMGYPVTVSDGFIVGEPKLLAIGTGRFVVRVCTKQKCWMIFDVWCKKLRVVKVRIYPACAPEKRIDL